MKKTISFLVCNSGFGHFKRVMSVCNALREYQRNLNIHVFCSPMHLDILKKSDNFLSKEFANSINFSKELFEFEPDWHNKRNLNSKSREKWLFQLLENQVLQHSDLIISDNQITPLQAYSNILLMGSFLWCDISFGEERTKSIVDIQSIEKQLLLKLKPKLICLSEMVLPSAALKTQIIPIPWVCEKSQFRKTHFKKSKKNNILFTGGGTQLFNEKLKEIVIKLLKTETAEIFLDFKLYQVLKGVSDKLKLFSFTELEFLKLDLIICRPGIGTLTDVIRYNIPVCLHKEYNNEEINFNAKRASDLGIGVILDVFNVENIIELLEDEERMNCIIASIEKRKVGGGNEISNIILDELKVKHESLISLRNLI